MTESIIAIGTALISAASAIVVCLIESRTSRKKQNDQFMKEHLESLDAIKKDYNEGLNSLRQELREVKSDLNSTLSDLKYRTEQSIGIIDLKISELEKKQDKHNSVIERTFHLEQNVAVIQEQIKVGNHRIEDLEKKEA